MADFIRDVSLCGGQWLMRKLTTGQDTKSKYLWRAQMQMGHLYHTVSPNLRDHPGRGDGKIVRSEMGRDLGQTVFFGHDRAAALLDP